MSLSSQLVRHKGTGGRVLPGLRSLFVVAGCALVVLTGVVIRFESGPGVASTPHYTYGGLPSWLPRTVTATSRVIEASAQRPRVAIPGDVVRVNMAGATTTALMVGPQTPPFVAPPPPSTTTTFTLSLRGTRGVVVLRARDFAILDGKGRLLRPTSFVGGDRSVLVSSSATSVVRLRTVMAVGSGTMRWSPGGHPVVTWEFTVEND